MINGTYTDVEGRVSKLEDIKPCSMLAGWIHATKHWETFEKNEWVKKHAVVTLCVWGNHGVRIDKEQI